MFYMTSRFDNYFNRKILNRYKNLFINNENANISTEHKYSFNNRVNLSDITAYIIDPIGSTDADDAFFINNENILGIVIADPTHYFDINNEIFNVALRNVVTFYPSKNEPLHLMPKEVLKEASLLPMNDVETKKGIVLLCDIGEDNLLYNPNIIFANIGVSKEKSFSYEIASSLIGIDDTITKGVNIGKALKLKRTLGKESISDLNLSNPVLKNGKMELVVDDINIRLCKEMIAEFAIYFNSYVGKILTDYYKDAIFRTFNHDIIQTKSKDILREIIDTGKSAEYSSKVKKHSLVNVDSYTHFTSPLRRVSDLIAHYLLKSMVLNESIPIKEEDLKNYALDITRKNKQLKKIYYDDNKLRCLEAINSIIERNGNVNIKMRFINYTGLFINLMIENVDNNDVSISISFLVRNFTKEDTLRGDLLEFRITEIGELTGFDSDIFPEIYNYLIS